MIKIEMRRPEFTAYRTAEGNTIIIADDFVIECESVGKSWDCVVRLDDFDITDRRFTCPKDHFVAYNKALESAAHIHSCVLRLFIEAMTSSAVESVKLIKTNETKDSLSYDFSFDDFDYEKSEHDFIVDMMGARSGSLAYKIVKDYILEKHI